MYEDEDPLEEGEVYRSRCVLPMGSGKLKAEGEEVERKEIEKFRKWTDRPPTPQRMEKMQLDFQDKTANDNLLFKWGRAHNDLSGIVKVDKIKPQLDTEVPPF